MKKIILIIITITVSTISGNLESDSYTDKASQEEADVESEKQSVENESEDELFPL